MTPSEAELIDYLFYGAEVHYSERQQFLAAGGLARPFNSGSPSKLTLSMFYKKYHIDGIYNGEIKITKIILTEENKRRIYEYLAKQ